jgi:hypothetical protein
MFAIRAEEIERELNGGGFLAMLSFFLASQAFQGAKMRRAG